MRLAVTVAAGSEVVSKPPYLHILNNPPPWTKRILPRFGPFDRAVGERLSKIGRGFGVLPDVAGVRLMKTDQRATGKVLYGAAPCEDEAPRGHACSCYSSRLPPAGCACW
jgi:hypothetical protein